MRLTGIILTLMAIYGFTANPLIAGICNFSSKKLEAGCEHKIPGGRIGTTSRMIKKVIFNKNISETVQTDKRMHTYKVTISTDALNKWEQHFNSKNNFNATLFWVKAEDTKLNKQVEALGKIYDDLGYFGDKALNKIPILGNMTLPCLGDKNKKCSAYYLMDHLDSNIEKQTLIDFSPPPEKILKQLIAGTKDWGENKKDVKKNAKIKLLAELVHFTRVVLTNMEIEPGTIVQAPRLYLNSPNNKTEFNFDENRAKKKNFQGLFTVPWLTLTQSKNKEDGKEDEKDDSNNTEIENDFRYKLLKMIRILHKQTTNNASIGKHLPKKLRPLLDAADGHLSAEAHESPFAFNVPMMLIQYNLSQNRRVVYAYESQGTKEKDASTSLNKLMIEFFNQRTTKGIKTSKDIHDLARLWSQHFSERWQAMHKTRTKIRSLFKEKTNEFKFFEENNIRFYAHSGGLLAELLLGDGAIFGLGDINSNLQRSKQHGNNPEEPLYKNWGGHLSNAITLLKKIQENDKKSNKKSKKKSKLVLRMGAMHAFAALDYLIKKEEDEENEKKNVAKKLSQGSEKTAFDNLSLLNENEIKTVALTAVEPAHFPHLHQRLDQGNSSNKNKKNSVDAGQLSVSFENQKESSYLMAEFYSPYKEFNGDKEFFGLSKTIQAIVPQKSIEIFTKVKLGKKIKEWAPGKWNTK
ncbi:MAG: hypothetical protein GY754_23100 [bacterium]|nr:hypothetical protein [bacterium]